MGQVSTPTTWNARGRQRRKMEDNIKQKEDPEKRERKEKEKNIVAINSGTYNHI